MRWATASTVRAFSTEIPPKKDFQRVAALAKLWEKYTFRHEILTSSEQPAVQITRSDRNYLDYGRISLHQGCPRLILQSPQGKIEQAKAFVQGYMRNAFVRGIGLQDEKKEFLAHCDSVFFEVLRAIREEDFSNLAEFTLGGHETLQFHRSAAHKLSKIQKEALNITQDDLLGDNGYIVKFPYLRHEMGPYIHSIEFTNVDAVGNTHLGDGEKPLDKIFCRYKVVLGGCYKFDSLLNEIRKGSQMWSQRIKTPKDYTFKWPRYTIVELDICQQAYSQMPIRLNDTRYLYDFHVFSF
ncbi:Mitochondrial genome maintenance exonuclease 1 [Caenorhabditis elegans]|uniref:Mitochondrial genome maintenance exonuclease 1 n=1 Tax=Caenorhabditis elegans TaxID=6239 RepID=Q9N3C2_CAEEL|nr:Mitochondrial genome maintenance exonuclease 1 [Caenorhabditis elegans]CCD73832.1 Mitochondrial genome maintenance exonuclease 1 [Caenorhabditis elegans]|eukprot:NP_497581.3 Uncharacterized protein CELE_Y54F10AR.2 [Caenorhabditis elegans]